MEEIIFSVFQPDTDTLRIQDMLDQFELMS